MPTGPQKFGVFLAPFHALHEDPTEAMQRDLELIEHLDKRGFYEVWVGEHHSGGFEIIAAPEVFIAAAAERTKNIRLGTGVKSISFYHPYLLADTMVQLDHMTRGRVMFGIGPGALPADAYRVGMDVTIQRRRMNEAIDVIVPLLEGKVVDAETDWFVIRQGQLQLSSYTKPRMEMAVTTMTSPAGVQVAGRHGLGVLVLGSVSDEAVALHAKNWGIYEQACAENGHTADRDNWRVTVFMHLAETMEQAREDLAFGFDDWVDYARDVLPASPVPADMPKADWLDHVIDSKFCIVGTPDDAIREIERVNAGLGGFGKLLILAHNWAPYDRTLKSYDLFTRYVAPHFTGNNEQRRTSYDYSRDHPAFARDFNKAVQQSQDDWEKQQKEKGKSAAE